MSTAAWAKMRHRVYVLSYTVYMFHFVCICQNLNYGEGSTWLMYMYRCLREIGLNLDCMHQFYHMIHHTLLHAYAWDSYKFSGHINIQWKLIVYGPWSWFYLYTFTDYYIASPPCFHCMLRYECTYCMMFYIWLMNNFLHRVNVRSSIQNLPCYFLAAQNFKWKFISRDDISNNLMAWKK